jgi:hypothetical protein
MSGQVFDGYTHGLDRQFFSARTVFVSWSGFIDPRRGHIVGFRVALSPSSDVSQCGSPGETASVLTEDMLSVPPSSYQMCTWLSIVPRETWAFRGVELSLGQTYYAFVAAVDRVGHVGDLGTSSGQVGSC